MDIGSEPTDVRRLLARYRIRFEQIPSRTPTLIRAEAMNQMPTLMLFRDGVYLNRLLGAQSAERLGQ